MEALSIFANDWITVIYKIDKIKTVQLFPNDFWNGFSPSESLIIVGSKAVGNNKDYEFIKDI